MKKIIVAVASLLVVLLLAGCAAPAPEQPGGETCTHEYEWMSDSEGHWQLCKLCKDTTQRAPHAFEGEKCPICGYSKSTPTPPPTPQDDYEFGDSVSRENTAFYEDYSEEEKELFYTLWEETTSVTVKIDISGHELAKINEANESGNPALQDTYRKCALTITVNGKDYTYDEVGIRMRGNTSRRNFCDENGNIYAYVHFRFSLTETFDGEEYKNAWAEELYHDWTNDEAGRKARKDRSFATMEKFYYKWNKNYDQTYIREIYANRMFQAFGVLAPHITLAEIDIRQGTSMESLGVGGLYELIDKQFIKRNFDKEHKGGDLYKCTYTGRGPADLTGKGYGLSDDDPYCLKTNDDPEGKDWSDHKYIKAFIAALNDRQGNFTENFEKLMSPDYFARFEACNYLAGNPDCIRNNYNNYYLYFTPQGTAYVIPYDYDRCFGITRDWNPMMGMVYTGPFERQNATGENRNPLYTRTILDDNAPYRDLYASKIEEVLNSKWFTLGNFTTLYEAYRANYGTRTAPSQVIVRQCGGNVETSRFSFSLSGTNNYTETGENISVEEYMRVKRETALAALQ